MRATVCDFRKYEITDLSKLNVSGSYTPVSATRRENVMSWPPRKAVPSLSSPSGHSPVPHVDYSAPCQASGWEPVTSPLHMNEDKILDDIPEESGDEWDNLHIHSTQERQLQQQQQQLQQQQRGREVKSASKSSRASAERSGRCLRKAKSETNLGEKPRVASLFDEMMSGSWDSGKVLERSASVSEVKQKMFHCIVPFLVVFVFMSTSFHHLLCPLLCSVFAFFFSHPSSSLPCPSFMNSVLVSDYVICKTFLLIMESVT